MVGKEKVAVGVSERPRTLSVRKSVLMTLTLYFVRAEGEELKII